MAIFTKLAKKEIRKFILNYDIGNIKTYSPIHQGIQNSNYYINTKGKRFVLTVFEDKIIIKNLKFYINLLHDLHNAGFCTPYPIKDLKGNSYSKLSKKPVAIFNFIEGKSRKKSYSKHLSELGIILAKIHKKTMNFKLNKKNDYSYHFLKTSLDFLFEDINIHFPNLTNIIQEDIQFYKEIQKVNMPQGIIHADLFPDNVLFKHDRITGILDFFYSCRDFLIIDLAIIIISWCFTNENKNMLKIETSKIKMLLRGYNKIRKLKILELNNLDLFCKVYCIRFFLTRLNDSKLQHDKNVVTTKQPEEFIHKYLYLKSHNINFLELMKNEN